MRASARRSGLDARDQLHARAEIVWNKARLGRLFAFRPWEAPAMKKQAFTQRFIDALRHLEETGDVDGLVQLFAEDAEISNPLVQHHGGGRGAAQSFWTRYRGTFKTITSEFRSVADGDGISFLEWASSGTTRGGAFRYGGVSVIEHKSGQITAFRSYFDPAQLSLGMPEKPRDNAEESLENVQKEAAEQRKEGGYL
jgi:ketosteroid isomerase-like protein